MYSPHLCGGRTCRLIFLVKVWVHFPWVPSYSTISRTNRVLVSSDKLDAFTSFASATPSGVEGQFDFAATAAFSAVRKCDGFVFVTSRRIVPESARRPVPWHPGQLVELPPNALLIRPSPPQIRQVSTDPEYCMNLEYSLERQAAT